MSAEAKKAPTKNIGDVLEALDGLKLDVVAMAGAVAEMSTHLKTIGDWLQALTVADHHHTVALARIEAHVVGQSVPDVPAQPSVSPMGSGA